MRIKLFDATLKMSIISFSIYWLILYKYNKKFILNFNLHFNKPRRQEYVKNRKDKKKTFIFSILFAF